MRAAKHDSAHGSSILLAPTRARRGVDCAIVCGVCNHLIATRHGYRLVFVDRGVQGKVERLPATVDCPFCHVPNLLDARQLNVSEDQLGLGPTARD